MAIRVIAVDLRERLRSEPLPELLDVRTPAWT